MGIPPPPPFPTYKVHIQLKSLTSQNEFILPREFVHDVGQRSIAGEECARPAHEFAVDFRPRKHLAPEIA